MAARLRSTNGEGAVAILAPSPIKDRDKASGEETDNARLLPCERLTGESHAHLLAPMRSFAESLGFSVSFESIPGETGRWCDQKARQIMVDTGAPANAQLSESWSTRRSTLLAPAMPSTVASVPR